MKFRKDNEPDEMEEMPLLPEIEIQSKKINDKVEIQIEVEHDEDREFPEEPPFPDNDFIGRRAVQVSNELRSRRIKLIALVVGIIVFIIGAYAWAIYSINKTELQNRIDDTSNIVARDMVLAYDKEKLQIRTEWDEDYDLVYKLKVGKNVKGGLEFIDSGLIENESKRTEVNTAYVKKLKNMQSDISPLTFEHNIPETVGGTNGWKYCINIALQSHGFTEADIGSVYNDDNGTDFVIVQIKDKNNFLVYPTAETISREDYGFKTPLSPMTYVSGKSTKKSVSFANDKATRTQLHPVGSSINTKITVNDEKLSTSAPGYVKCSDVQIDVSYDVMDVVAALKFIVKNAGKNTNDSIADADIKTKYYTVTYSYLFTDNGACTVKQSVQFEKDLKFNSINMTQSSPVLLEADKNGYLYVPNSKKYYSVSSMPSENTDIKKADWDDEKNPPYRAFNFNDDMLDFGFCTGYNPTIGSAAKETRVKNIDSAIKIDEKGNIIPYLLSKSTTVKKGTTYEAVYYRIPVENGSKYFEDEDFTSICWYYLDDEIYLMLDTHTNVDKVVALPDNMVGMKVSVVDIHKNTAISDSLVTKTGIHFRNTGNYGYAVLKLSK